MRLKSAAILGVAIGGTLFAGPVAAAPDQTQGVALMSAIVNADGSLKSGTGVVSSERIDAGIYEVRFNRDIRDCVPVATVFEIGFAQLSEPAAGTLVNVGTHTANGGLSDFPFSLLVFCPK